MDIIEYSNILKDIIDNLIVIRKYKTKPEKQNNINKCINIINKDLNIINRLGTIKKLNKNEKINYDNLLNVIYEQIKHIYLLIIKYKKRIINRKKTYIFNTKLKNIIYYIELLNNCIQSLPNFYITD